jgi:hypothetical protein
VPDAGRASFLILLVAGLCALAAAAGSRAATGSMKDGTNAGNDSRSDGEQSR